MDGGIILEKHYRSADMETTEAFLETIFDGTSEEIMVVDGNGIIQDVNRVFLDERGLKMEAVLGKKCYDIKRISGTHCSLEARECPLLKAKDFKLSNAFCLEYLTLKKFPNSQRNFI